MLRLKSLGIACAAVMFSIGAAQAQPMETGEHARYAGRVIEHMCSDQAQKPQSGKRGDRLAERLALTDAQKGLFKDLQDARQKAREDMRTALCSPKPDFSTFAGHLNFHQNFWKRSLPL